MGVPEHVIRYWRAQDAVLASNQPTRWGAVVTDARFPRVWDTNYARIDRAAPGLTADEVARSLSPALRAAGAGVFHVVSFVADQTAGLMAELSGAGHTLGWDLVMDLNPGSMPPGDPAIQVEILSPGPELWSTLTAAYPLFGDGDGAADQIPLQSTVLAPAGKRWSCVRDEVGSILSVAAVLSLDGVSYVDDVATFPRARGRGLASALTLAVCRTALAGGARHVWLMADPGDERACAMYRRLGFRDAGPLASSKGPIP